LTAYIQAYGGSATNGYWIGLADLTEPYKFLWESNGEELVGGRDSELWGNIPPQPDSGGSNCVAKYGQGSGVGDGVRNVGGDFVDAFLAEFPRMALLRHTLRRRPGLGSPLPEGCDEPFEQRGKGRHHGQEEGQGSHGQLDFSNLLTFISLENKFGRFDQHLIFLKTLA